MTNFVNIILIEIIFVLSISLIVLLVLNWKKKKKKTAEIERLLGQVEENGITRKEHLVNILTNQLAMQEQPAVELVEDFIAAEKRFTHQFLEIQLNQQPISGFYQHECEVLDKYLQLIAENIPKAINSNLDITGEASTGDEKGANNSEEIEQKSEQTKEKDTDPEILDPNSEQTDGKEADNPSSSEAESIEEINISETEEDEFAEEPDWGDAFAEAGVEMDENSEEK